MPKIKTAIILALLVCAVPAAAVDDCAMYLKLQDINGEVSFQGQTGWIPLAGVKIGPPDEQTGDILRPVILAWPSKITGPQMSALGNLDGMGIELTKQVDTTSPRLMSAWRDKHRFPSAKLALCSAADHGEILYSFDLTGVTIVGFEEKDNRQVLSLRYETIKF